ncbi:hypothetical protein Ciccas_010372 [Cichlidogyrus casuarinus]|uniref:Uncharacterized protein n=1 Tax=Cichlidogyrus casuarinus TaxID=1844966 RepID=A0ABD2PWA5_9PLAT
MSLKAAPSLGMDELFLRWLTDPSIQKMLAKAQDKIANTNFGAEEILACLTTSFPATRTPVYGNHNSNIHPQPFNEDSYDPPALNGYIAPHSPRPSTPPHFPYLARVQVPGQKSTSSKLKQSRVSALF